ncbi:MAG: hypothetical protein ACO4CS_17345 [bacterium]
MSIWINNRLPTLEDADLHGMVRWGKDKPGMLMHWKGVRANEFWSHSSAWKRPPACYSEGTTCASQDEQLSER